MRWTVLIGLVFILFVDSTMSRANEPFWIAQVSSTYVDQETGESRTLRGIGTIVELDGQSFILTAAHVSQGKGLEIQIGDRRVRASSIERLADNLNDIELIRLDDKVDPLAVFQDSDKRGYFAVIEYPEGSSISKKYLKSLEEFRSSSITVSGEHYRAYLPPNVSSTKEWKKKAPMSGERHATPVLQWPDKSLRTTLDGEDYLTDISIVSGMSGAPLLGMRPLGLVSKVFRNEDNTPKPFVLQTPDTAFVVIQGIGKSYFRDFERSHFASATHIAKLVSRYRTGERGRVGSIEWKMRYGLTYRDFGDGALEINPRVQPAGGGGSADGGGGGSADGGGGLVRSRANAWDRFEIDAGMKWKGASVIAFEVAGKKSPESRIALAANIDAVQFMNKHEELQVSPVPLSEIGSLIEKKIRRAHGIQQIVPTETDACLIEILSGSERKFRVSFKSPGRFWSQESISFELDSKGVLTPGGVRFQPIVEVKSTKSGQTYRIDITGLFAVDLSSLSGEFVTLLQEASDNRSIARYSTELFIIPKYDDSTRDKPMFCTARVGGSSSCPNCANSSQSGPISATDIMSIWHIFD